MERDQTSTPGYQKGFNEGYTIAKYLPELGEQLAKATGDSERSLGFQDGQKQLILEQSKEKYPAWLKGDRTGRNITDISKAKDKDIEPER